MSFDYEQHLDEEVWRYIADADAARGPIAEDAALSEKRAGYARSCRALAGPHPPGMRTEDFTIPGGPKARAYRPTHVWREDLLILFFHGGGWVLGDLETHDDACSHFSEQSGTELIAVDYKLAPEAPHPAQFDDCLSAARWALQQGRQLILVGDSAGGTLAASVAHVLRDQAIIGQLLIYPYLGAPTNSPSMIEHAQAPNLSADDMRAFLALRGATIDDAIAAPLNDSDFSGLPPTALFAAECDALASDAVLYAEQLKQAGVNVTLTVEPGLVHAYLRARAHSSKANASIDRMVTAIKTMGKISQ